MFESINQQILACLSKRISLGDSPVIGFDVFDTLITRRIPKEYSLNFLCRYLSLEYFYNPNSWDSALNIYKSSYFNSCQKNTSHGRDYETSSDDLFDGMVRGFSEAGADINIEKLKSSCINFEIHFSTLMPGIHALLSSIAKLNIPIVYISDMYYGKYIIDQLLLHFDILSFFDDGFVSSDYALLKRTGNLFPEVLDILGISSTNFLFVGDDFFADVEQPKKLQIECFHYTNIEIENERKELFDLFNDAELSKDKIVPAVLRSSSGLSFENHSIENYSCNKYLGPYFSSFAFAVYDLYKSSDYSIAIFAAREGLFLKQLTDCFDKWHAPDLTLNKLYFPSSRLTALSYSLVNEGLSMMDVVNLAKNGQPTIRTMLSFLQLDEDRLYEICEEAGIQDPDFLLPPNLHEWLPIYTLLDVVNSCQEYLNFREQGVLFHKWMQDIGLFDGQRKLFVDLGWSGQIQSYLSRGFRRRGINVVMDGIYSGMRLEAHLNRRPYSDLLWYHCDETSNDTISKPPLWFPQILETLCRSPHGTVVGFTESQGTISPFFCPNRNSNEVSDDEFICRIQHSILTYASRFALLCLLYSLKPRDLIPHVSFSNFKFLMCPETDVARLFSSFSNVSDLGSSELFHYTGGMGIPCFDDQRFAELEKTTLWPTGAFASFYGEEHAYLYAEEFIRNRKKNSQLVRVSRFTSFNKNCKLNDSIFNFESSVPADKTTLQKWNSVVDKISSLSFSLAQKYMQSEVKYTSLPGELILSPESKWRLKYLVDLSENDLNRKAWPLPNCEPSANLAQHISRLEEQIANIKHAFNEKCSYIMDLEKLIRSRDSYIQDLKNLGLERYNAILEMEKMIGERDNTIKQQTQLCIDRDSTINELKQVIDDKDRIIQKLTTESKKSLFFRLKRIK